MDARGARTLARSCDAGGTGSQACRATDLGGAALDSSTAKHSALPPVYVVYVYFYVLSSLDRRGFFCKSRSLGVTSKVTSFCDNNF